MTSRFYPRWPLLALLALAAAFENYWMWGDGCLILGLPINLAYHLGLCVVASFVLAAVVRWAWPADSDRD